MTLQSKFKANSKIIEYKIEKISDNRVHAKKSKSGYWPGFYYLLLWKSYPKEKNNKKLALAI